MHEVMIDLETMGTGPGAAILAIGAVAMDFDSLTLGQTWYTTIDLGSSVQIGGVIDASTVLWWLKQSDEARAAVTRGERSIHEALIQLSIFLQTVAEGKRPHIWGNGATFDNVILRTAYQRLSLDPPWDYRGDRCFRTMRAMYPQVPKVEPVVEHNALDDARAQATQLLNILKYARVES
jgi:exodeoxyribonuclease VIII